jgi:hypothetical protein
MVYLNKYFFLLSIFFLVACTSSKNNITKNTLPNWYLNITNNTNEYIYGKAQANDLKEAKLLALEDMSNKLIVQLQSSFSSTTNVSKNFYDKTSTKEISQSNKKILFQNYKTLKSEYLNQEYYILLQVNRKLLSKTYKDKLNLLHNTIKSHFLNSQKKDKLQEIYLLIKLQKEILKAKEILYILTALQTSFDKNKYLQYYESIATKLTRNKENLKISINSNHKKGFFKNKLTQELNNSSYSISKNNPDVNIILHNTIIYSKAYGWFIVKVNSNIKVLSNNKILSSHTINSIGRSSSNNNNALISASKDFETKLIALTIDNLLYR